MSTNKNKLTVTVGIPAHNEEQNIANILQSVLGQKGDNFILERVIVVCDGCSDKTAEIASAISQKNSRVEVITDRERRGYLARLNQLYEMNQSEIYISFDADIVLNGPSVIEKMVKVFQEDPRVCLAAAHQIPLKPDTFIGKIIYFHHILWDEIRLAFNGGDNIHGIHGAASGLRKSFTDTVRYPNSLTSGPGFLYIMAKKYGKFRYINKASIFYRPVSTLKDLRIQGTRAVFNNQKKLAEYFGKWIYGLYTIPVRYKITGILKMIWRHPVYTSLTMALGLWLRFFPKQDKLYNKGMWEIVPSTKKAINHFPNK
ncbi:MAG: glycosyltransferase family 2 protein [Patescibacteria group bacterium]